MFAKICTLGVMIVAVSLSGASPTLAETLQFDFKSAADAQGWKAASEIPWEVGRRGYRPLQFEGAYPVSLLGKPVFKNARVTVEISDLRAGSFGAIIIRAKATETTISGYLAILGNIDGTNGFVEIDKLTDVPFDGLGGGDVEIPCSKNVVLAGGRLSVVAKGAKIKVLYNDEVFCTLDDGSFKKGRVGLFTNYPPDTFPSFRSVVIEY
jgi:hypothetical protein